MVRLLSVWALVGLIIFPAAVFSAAQYHDYSQYIHWEGGFETPEDEITSAVSCEIFGTNYWATTGVLSGLSFYGIGENGPEPLSSIPLAGAEQDVVFDGGIAYVIAQPARLNKVIAYNPGSPAVQWTDVLPYDPFDVAQYGHYLLIACGINGLVTYDLTEVFNYPIGVVGGWSGTADEVLIHGNTALVRTNEGITTLDLTDPTIPVPLDSLPMTNIGVLQLDGSRLFAGVGDGLIEVEITDPAQLGIIQSWPNLVDWGAISSIALAEGGMFLTSGNKMDFLDLETGQLTWSGMGASGARSMVQSEGSLGLACGAHGFQVFAHEPPVYAPSTSPFTSAALLHDLQVEGRYFFGFSGRTVYCYDMGLVLPYLAWSHTASGPYEYTEALTVVGDRVYIGYNNGQVRILEYGPDQATQELAYFQTGGEEVRDLGPLEGYLAVFSDPSADVYRQGLVEIFDLADLSSPVVTDSYVNNNYPRMWVSGNTLLLWDHTSSHNGIQFLDASDPHDLVAAAHLSTPVFSEVTVNGDHLYIVEPPIMKAADFSNPYSIQQGPTINIPNGWYLEVSGDAGYLLYTDLVFDLSDPLNPVPIGSSSNEWITGASACAAGDGYLVAGIGSYLTLMPGQGSGLVPVEDEVPGPGKITLRAVPNPFNPRVKLEFSLIQAGLAEIDVFDVRGRRVARLGGRFQAGAQTVPWDGRSSDGRDLPSGVYLARVKTAQGQAVSKVVLAR